MPVCGNRRVILRPYQTNLYNDIQSSWRVGQKNVCAVAPTGSGKTVIFSEVIRNTNAPSVAIAHRQELVVQISKALAIQGVYHGIVGPKNVIKAACGVHVEETGRSYYIPDSPVKVAGVDTLIRRKKNLSQWSRGVKLWVMDEAHHILNDNKWGKAVEMFPRANGLGVTATPLRTDKRGLSRETDGVFDTLVQGPEMRTLIDQGFLADYRIFAPPSDFRRENVEVSQTTGDFKPLSLVNEIKKSSIMGDVVSHYKRYAPGKLGVTFAPSVDVAKQICNDFIRAGVTAEVVHAGSNDAERIGALRRFKQRKTMQLVNCDLFGEGFDLPAIECVSMARATESYGLFVQQFGRGLRPMEGKTHGILIDHVGNVMRHGLPDTPRQWTLDRGEKRSSSKKTTVKTCPKCTAVFDRVFRECPYCGFYPEPTDRTAPEFVDGDLTELTPETLAKMRRDVQRIDMPAEDYQRWLLRDRHVPPINAKRNTNIHVRNQIAQKQLREALALWGGVKRAAGIPDYKSYREFYIKFNIDVLSAQSLKAAEAEELNTKVRSCL